MVGPMFLEFQRKRKTKMVIEDIIALILWITALGVCVYFAMTITAKILYAHKIRKWAKHQDVDLKQQMRLSDDAGDYLNSFGKRIKKEKHEKRKKFFLWRLWYIMTEKST